MTMNVKITIGGDVIIYDKDGFWNLVFVTDVSHRAEYTVGGVKDSLRTPNSDRCLRLVLGDEQSAETRSWGTNADKIFNMSHPRMHDHAGGKSKLRVLHASPPFREIVHLKIPRGTVDAACWYSNYLYGLYPGIADQPYGPAAKLVSLSFSVQNLPGKPALSLIDDHGNPVGGPWPYAPGDFGIILDNDCKGTSTALDFLHYYDWVREPRPSRKYFVAMKDPLATVFCNDLGELRQGKGPKGIDGNCDPTRIFPPPLP